MPAAPDPQNLDELVTPALLVDQSGFRHNLTTMSAAKPGRTLRPHVKAFKSTDVARQLTQAGHGGLCCATIREIEGLVAAGVGDDLLLANEVLDARRLGALVDAGANITVAVDSTETIEAAAAGGVKRALIDVNVGLPRCGCAPSDAERLADTARTAGLEVRGVMGYEGHLMAVPDRAKQKRKVDESMALLLEAHAAVGGELVSAGGTGTFDLNDAATEIQAGSYLFMDTHYAKIDLPFVQCLSVLATVISVNRSGGWAVLDAGLKAFGMDHGDPTIHDGEVLFLSDEHTTWAPSDLTAVSIGDRVRIWPAHVDPTIAKHGVMWVHDGATIVDRWAVDLPWW